MVGSRCIISRNVHLLDTQMYVARIPTVSWVAVATQSTVTNAARVTTGVQTDVLVLLHRAIVQRRMSRVLQTIKSRLSRAMMPLGKSLNSVARAVRLRT